MAIVVMLGWWYGQGWLWAIQGIGRRLGHIGSVFAVRVLIRTWFSPWKQITSPSSFRNFFQAAVDNTISRVIGGFVRTIMLVIALLWAIFVIASGFVFIIVWPFLPFSVFILPLLMASGVTL
jgi:hypothetical protein